MNQFVQTVNTTCPYWVGGVAFFGNYSFCRRVRWSCFFAQTFHNRFDYK